MISEKCCIIIVLKYKESQTIIAMITEEKRTFSLSQMSNDELAQSLPWRENEG